MGDDAAVGGEQGIMVDACVGEEAPLCQAQCLFGLCREHQGEAVDRCWPGCLEQAKAERGGGQESGLGRQNELQL